MNNEERIIIENAMNKVLKGSKLSWIINSDILLTLEDLQQELWLKYLTDYSYGVFSEQYLVTFFSSRLKNIKRDYDRAGNFERGELNDSFVFEDSSSLRASLIEAFNTLEDTISKKDMDFLFSYYVYGETFEDIARNNGYSNESGVRRYHKRLLARVKPDLVELLSQVKPKGVVMC